MSTAAGTAHAESAEAGAERTTAPGSLLDYALRYAELGFRVLPVNGVINGACTCASPDCRSAGKHPDQRPRAPRYTQCHDGPRRAPPSGSRGRSPGKRNIAIRVGERHVAIDVDIAGEDADEETRKRKCGDKTLAALIAKHGPLPDTAMAHTGGGGEHYLFTKPEGAKFPGQLGAAIDIKTDNGYIVVEPSVHKSGGTYQWEGAFDPLDGCAPVPCPEWVLTFAKTRPSGGLIESAGTMPAHQRADIERAIPYLRDIIDGYIVWRDVGMALHSTGAPEAFGLWVQASKLSIHFDLDECNRIWRSFKQKDGGKTLGTLFAYAKANGYIQPKDNVVPLSAVERARQTHRIARNSECPRQSAPGPSASRAIATSRALSGEPFRRAGGLGRGSIRPG